MCGPTFTMARDCRVFGFIPWSAINRSLSSWHGASFISTMSMQACAPSLTPEEYARTERGGGVARRPRSAMARQDQGPRPSPVHSSSFLSKGMCSSRREGKLSCMADEFITLPTGLGRPWWSGGVLLRPSADGFGNPARPPDHTMVTDDVEVDAWRIRAMSV